MAWSGSGTYTPSDGTYSGSNICASQAGDGDAVIHSTEMDLLITDLGTGINACLAKNGENSATANIPMGSHKLTGMAVGSSSTDSATYGQTITALSLATTTLTATRAAGDLTVDLATLAAGTGGVDLSTAQTVAGIKTFSSISSLVHAKFNGPTTQKVELVSSSSTPTFDTTAVTGHFIAVAQNQTWNFTWPTGATDTQLGANWKRSGQIMARWSSAGYTITLNSSMLSALTDYSTEGSPNTASGAMSSLTYTYWYIGGLTYAQFAWVSTP